MDQPSGGCARGHALWWARSSVALSVCWLGCHDIGSSQTLTARGSTAPASASTAPPVREVSAPNAKDSGQFEPEPSRAPAAEPSASDTLAWPELPSAALTSDFCTERVQALDDDACFALPPARTTTLLIYLHGIVPPTPKSVQKTNLFEVVANAAERAGVVALLPRGAQGFSPKASPGYWGWPTSKLGFERHGAEFVAKVRDKQRKLAALLNTTFERIYLAGSSSGAYFAAGILLFGAMPELQGVAVLSGGSGYPTPGFAGLPPKPVYIGFGSSDSVAAGARALGQQLSRAGWPVEVRAHPLPHGAREVYLDEAFGFWAAR